MNSMVAVLLDSTNDSPPQEVALAASSLHAMLLNERSWIGPETCIRVDGEAIPLRNAPLHVPFAALLKHILDALRAGQPIVARQWCDRLLAFDPTGRQEESSWAWFLNGVASHDTNPEHAARCYQSVGARTSLIRWAAMTNLASLWALEFSQAHTAAECLAKALTLSPRFLPAAESQRNLAGEMVRVRAPTPRGQRPWQEQFQSAGSVLATATSADVQMFLDETCLPNFRQLRLIPAGPYSPALAANIPITDQGAAAAEFELREARQAISDQCYDTAILLSEDVQQRRPASAAAAREITVEANSLLADHECLKRARSLCKWLRRFYQALAAQNCSAAQRAIDRLALFVTDEQLESVQRAFRQTFASEQTVSQ
jgi:hypothetical protein